MDPYAIPVCRRRRHRYKTKNNQFPLCGGPRRPRAVRAVVRSSVHTHTHNVRSRHASMYLTRTSVIDVLPSERKTLVSKWLRRDISVYLRATLFRLSDAAAADSRPLRVSPCVCVCVFTFGNYRQPIAGVMRVGLSGRSLGHARVSGNIDSAPSAKKISRARGDNASRAPPLNSFNHLSTAYFK